MHRTTPLPAEPLPAAGGPAAASPVQVRSAGQNSCHRSRGRQGSPPPGSCSNRHDGQEGWWGWWHGLNDGREDES